MHLALNNILKHKIGISNSKHAVTKISILTNNNNRCNNKNRSNNNINNNKIWELV